MREDSNSKKMDRSDKKAKSCFIIAPIGEVDSEERRRIDGHLELIYKPILLDLGYSKILASHQETKPGSITQQIIGHLFNDDLVICDLTGMNANVMYELSVRHAIQKPVVTVAFEGTVFPFDIKDDRHITFKNDEMGMVELKDKLPKVVEEAEKDTKPDNPISRYIKHEAVIQKIDASGTEIQQILFDEIADIKKMIKDITQEKKWYQDKQLVAQLERIGDAVRIKEFERGDNLSNYLANKTAASFSQGNAARNALADLIKKE